MPADAAELALIRADLLDLLKVCGIDPAGVMNFQDDLLAVTRYVRRLETERDEAQERVRLLEIASAECGLQHETSYTAGTEAMRGAVVQWCAERRLTQWAATFRELPITPTPTATPDDDVK